MAGLEPHRKGGWNEPLNNTVKDVQGGQPSKTSGTLNFFSFSFFPEAEFVQHFSFPNWNLSIYGGADKLAKQVSLTMVRPPQEWGWRGDACTQPGF